MDKPAPANADRIMAPEERLAPIRRLTIMGDGNGELGPGGNAQHKGPRNGIGKERLKQEPCHRQRTAQHRCGNQPGHPNSPDDLPGSAVPIFSPQDLPQLIHGHPYAADPQIQQQEQQQSGPKDSKCRKTAALFVLQHSASFLLQSIQVIQRRRRIPGEHRMQIGDHLRSAADLLEHILPRTPDVSRLNRLTILHQRALFQQRIQRGKLPLHGAVVDQKIRFLCHRKELLQIHIDRGNRLP